MTSQVVEVAPGDPPATPTPAVLSGGEAVVRSLERHGIAHVFGIPGDHTIPLYRALGRSAIAHHTTRHEQGAGFMADGLARASQQPGVALVIGGPGLTNIATALGEAYADGVPLLVISAEIDSADIEARHDHNHEMKDQIAAMGGICASSQRILRPADVPAAIDRAMAVFRGGRPRSVHLSIPTDVLEAQAVVSFEPLSARAPTAPDAAQVERAAVLLRAARAPLLVLGGGARGARAAAQQLAEVLASPVLVTWAGKDAFPNDHPLFAGSGLNLLAARHELATADVVLAVGTQLGRTDFWDAPASIGGQMVRVDVDPEQVDANVPATLGLVGDARVALEHLANALGGRRRAADGRAARLQAALAAEAERSGARYRPWLSALRRALPAESVLAFDSTLVTYRGSYAMPVPLGGAWLYPSAYGTLGYALPAAIGAAIGQPGRPAAVVTGDGGFLFTCAELLTAAEHGIGLPVVVWNDRGYGTIRQGMRARGMEPLGVDFAIPDLAALARGLGAAYARPDSPTALEHATRGALRRSLPTLLEVEDLAWQE